MDFHCQRSCSCVNREDTVSRLHDDPGSSDLNPCTAFQNITKHQQSVSTYRRVLQKIPRNITTENETFKRYCRGTPRLRGTPMLTQTIRQTPQAYELTYCLLRLWLVVALSQDALLSGEKVESGLLSKQMGQFRVKHALTLEIKVHVLKGGSISTLHS